MTAILIVLATGITLAITLNGGSSSDGDEALPVLTTTTPRPPTPTPRPSKSSLVVEQLRALDRLLDTSGTTRGTVGAAVERIANCADLSDAKGDLLSAATSRDELVEELDKLTLSAVSGGGEMVADLRSAWVASAAADRAYGEWADEVMSICVSKAPATSSSLLAQQRSAQATSYKQRFVSSWNDWAPRYGFAHRNADEI